MKLPFNKKSFTIRKKKELGSIKISHLYYLYLIKNLYPNQNLIKNCKLVYVMPFMEILFCFNYLI